MHAPREANPVLVCCCEASDNFRLVISWIGASNWIRAGRDMCVLLRKACLAGCVAKCTCGAPLVNVIVDKAAAGALATR